MKRLYMRSGSVDGRQMSFCGTNETVGTVYESRKGYRTIVENHGRFDMPDGPAWGYTTREATAAEIEAANQPFDAKKEKAFWEDFFSATDTF